MMSGIKALKLAEIPSGTITVELMGRQSRAGNIKININYAENR
jgi:hypothetical protein